MSEQDSDTPLDVPAEHSGSDSEIESAAINLPPHAMPSEPADWQPYLDDIEGLDIPEEQARDLLKVLWQMMCTCADMGFELDPVQHVIAPSLEKAWRESGDALTVDEQDSANDYASK